MELDVGADQVGGDVGQRRLAGDAPEIRMAVDQRPQPADMRMVGPVLRADVEFLVGGGDPAALLDELLRARAQQLKPFARQQILRDKKPGREIPLALRLGQHARRVREDRFGRHTVSSNSSANPNLGQSAPE